MGVGRGGGPAHGVRDAHGREGARDRTDHLTLTIDGAAVGADLVVPPDARGIVVFAHGSGSSRHSPRNRMVAAELRTAGLATLLMDLLTEQEDAIDARTAELRFDIALLGRRLVGAIDWLSSHPETADLRVCLFGASTGAAAALVAAAERPKRVRAVVSRGGRPDLAGSALERVRCPVLLIVGGHDDEVVELNRGALSVLTVEKHIEVIPGATHLFEEPGAIEAVARLARAWFERHASDG